MAEDLFDALLVHDTWDDDGYRTMFTLRILTREGWTEVGTVKIGHVAMDSEDVANVLLPERFSRLDSSRWFSVGQDESYYYALSEMPGAVREEVLTALRDIAYDEDSFRLARNQNVTRTSLLRFVKMSTVRGQLQRIARGGARRVNFDIAYEPPLLTAQAARRAPVPRPHGLDAAARRPRTTRAPVEGRHTRSSARAHRALRHRRRIRLMRPAMGIRHCHETDQPQRTVEQG
ncbi:hypothetical protein ACFXG9_24040 [Streptomyces mirabilis]|uniref:hypothetical protein n=1 Tax=Streptomyces mirabilis TaxID=68239 RepID=UPI003695EBF1